MSAPQRILRIAARFLRFLRFCEARAENLCHQPRKVLQLFITAGNDIVRAVAKIGWRALLETWARFYEYRPARFHFRSLSASSRARAFLATHVSNDEFFVSRNPTAKPILEHVKQFKDDQNNNNYSDYIEDVSVHVGGYIRAPVRWPAFTQNDRAAGQSILLRTFPSDLGLAVFSGSN